MIEQEAEEITVDLEEFYEEMIGKIWVWMSMNRRLIPTYEFIYLEKTLYSRKSGEPKDKIVSFEGPDGYGYWPNGSRII